MEQMSYLKDENRRLNEACDDADEEISQLRENLLKAKQRLAEVEGAQKGLTQEEILRNIGCITSQSQHLELEKDNTSVESVVESNVKTPETKKNKVRKTLPTVTASPLSSSARKQKSEQCRQQ
uniref:Myosin_tail_1 domain-containing protein n=1 Tax=Syphacia muris TaxID=451379 RepID=A0A0N5ALL4_9BILA